MTNEKLQQLTAAVENLKPVSAWDKGVKAYALDLLEDLESALDYDGDILTNANLLVKALLNGASDWSQYSWGGAAMIYDKDIAKRLCTPSELKKTRNGETNPNKTEQWLDVQARALYQAERMILNQYRKLQ